MRIWPLIPGMLGMALAMTGVVVREPRIWVCPPREAALICRWRKSLAQRPQGKKEPKAEGGGLSALSWGDRDARLMGLWAAGPHPLAE